MGGESGSEGAEVLRAVTSGQLPVVSFREGALRRSLFISGEHPRRPVIWHKARQQTGPPENGASVSAKLQMGSDPPGADIEVDGSFVGNTPSDVQVAEGSYRHGEENWIQGLGAEAEGYGREQRASQCGAGENTESVAMSIESSASLRSAGQPRRLPPQEHPCWK